MYDELDEMLNSYKILQSKDDEIKALKEQLGQTEFERDSYLQKCQDYEKRLEEEESRYWQAQNDRKTLDPARPSAIYTTANDRVQKRLAKDAQDDHLAGLFSEIDQSEMQSVLGQTRATAENVEKHIRDITGSQKNIQALYSQLKHTAKFLAEIAKSLDFDDGQIEIIMQKINQLQLEVQETGEATSQLVRDTDKIVGELSAFSMRIEQTIRNSVQDSKTLDGHKNKSSPSKDLAEEENHLFELKTLQEQIEKICSEKESINHQLKSVTKGKKEAEQKYANAVNLLTERDEELENRKHIIEELRLEISQRKAPPDLVCEFNAQLQAIYDTMSAVTNRLTKL